MCFAHPFLHIYRRVTEVRLCLECWLTGLACVRTTELPTSIAKARRNNPENIAGGLRSNGLGNIGGLTSIFTKVSEILFSRCLQDFCFGGITEVWIESRV